jgi:sec-independent protein translocase protein TatA
MLNNLSGWHALVILAIVLLVFGSAKLPELARGLGQSVRILKDEVRDDMPATTARTRPTGSGDEVAERRVS